MSVDAKTVKRVAHLARIALPEAEVERMQGELNAILGFVEELAKVDVEGGDGWVDRVDCDDGDISVGVAGVCVVSARSGVVASNKYNDDCDHRWRDGGRCC